MEDYAAKMALKTEVALRAYVTGYPQYREVAVLAALDELRRRGQPAPEEAALRPMLEAAAAEQRAAELALEQVPPSPAAASRELPTDDDDDDDDAVPMGPPLYSLGLVVFLSMFSMLAGAAVVGLNLGRLRQWAGLAGLVGFVLAYMTGAALLFSWLLSQYGAMSGPMQTFVVLFNLPAILVYMLWYWPRYFSRVRHPGRSWLPPLLVCVGLLYGLQQLSIYFIEHQPREVRQEMEKLLNNPPASR